ncbi:MAG: phosphomannomutase/phosphoglucomutase, partial [Phycisphaerae bacterium]
MPPKPQDERRCPGEKYAISEAVCRGRIARHYPKCKDCKWREVTAGPDEGAAEPDVDLDTIFKAYDIRGLAEEQITRTVAWKVGFATARHLMERLPEGAKPEEQWIIVGRDMRPTSEEYAQRVADGVRAAGVGAMLVGEIETPAIYYAVGSRKALGGVQVTASHNPAAYNGFKITGPECVPVGMGSGLETIRDIAAGLTDTDLQPVGPLRQQDISSGYLLHVKKFAGEIRPMRIALDASNGMASKWVPSLLREFIVDVESLNLERSGRFNHEPNPLNAAALEDLKHRVRATDAACGVCFDGDADRVGFVDENGESIGNDLITALLVPEFLRDERGATIVYDLRSTRALKEEIEKHGGVPHRERVGHSHMKKALRETNAPFGGELSGHTYFRDNYFCD